MTRAERERRTEEDAFTITLKALRATGITDKQFQIIDELIYFAYLIGIQDETIQQIKSHKLLLEDIEDEKEKEENGNHN